MSVPPIQANYLPINVESAKKEGINIPKGHGGWTQGLSDLIGQHPATMAKMLKAFADGWLLFVNPNNTSAKNTSSWTGSTKNFISIFETFAFGQKFYAGATDMAAKKEHRTVKEGLSLSVNGLLTLSEGANGYATLMKAGIIFTGTAACIAAAKLFHELTGGISAVLGTIKSYIVINEKTAQVAKTQAKHDLTPTDANLKTNLKIQKLDLVSEKIFAVKNINYVAFGILTVMSLVAPAVIIPATLVWFLTVGTVVETVAKHFVDTHKNHATPTMNKACLSHGVFFQEKVV